MNLAQLEMNQTQVASNPKKYYLVYARKSSEGEDRQLESINDQLKASEEIKKRLGIDSIKTFSESRSAKAPGRPEFNRMIDEIVNRQDIKGIIAWDLKRLSRNPKDEGTLRWLLQSGMIEEIVTNSKTFTQVDSDFVMAIEGSQSQRFITDLKKDTARGIQSKLERGIAPVLAPPGYMNDLSKRQGERDILPHPVYFKLMRKVFDAFITGGFSIERLTYFAEELGIKNSRKKAISFTQMAVILRNPFYTGRFLYAGKLYKGKHKPMITDSEFDLVQQVLAKKTHARGSIHTDLLTGLLRCGECQRMITSEVKKKTLSDGSIKEYNFYRCTKRNRKCSQKYISAQDLEEAIDSHLSRIELAPRFVDWAIKWLKVTQENHQKGRTEALKLARLEYDSILKKRDRINDLMIDGALTSEEGRTKKIDIDIDRERAMQKINEIDEYVSLWSELSVQTFEFIKTMRSTFKEGSIHKRKAILRIIGSELILKDKVLQIQLRKPFQYVEAVATHYGKHKNKQLPAIPADAIMQNDGTNLTPSSTHSTSSGCHPGFVE